MDDMIERHTTITTQELIRRLHVIEDSVRTDRENNRDSRLQIIKMIEDLKSDISSVSNDMDSQMKRVDSIEDLNNRVVQLLEGAFGKDGLTIEVATHGIKISKIETKVNYIIGVFTGIQIIGFGTVIAILLNLYS